MIISIPVDPNHQAFSPLDKAYAHCRDTVLNEKDIGVEWDSKNQKVDWMFESVTNSKIHYNKNSNERIWNRIEFKSESDYVWFMLKWA